MSNKRQEIIKLAAGLMHSKGYENTKLSDILEAADIGKGNFYHYFTSKQELGLAVLDHVFSYWNYCLLENILSSEKDPVVKFDEMLEWVVNQQKQNHAKFGCVFGNLAVEMSEHDEVFRRKVESVFDKWTEKLAVVFGEMISSPAVAREKVLNFAQAIVAMLEGGILLMKSKQNIAVLENVAELARANVKQFVQQYQQESVA